MASYVNTEGFQDTRYFARSWAILTREQGWFPRMLLLWLGGLVPIVGSFAVSGYCAEWGRLTAWGVQSSPSHNGGTLGAYLRTGARNFVVGLVWMLAWGLLASLFAAIPVIGTAFGPIVSFLGVVFGVIVDVALLRATIYQNIGAGFKVSTISKMVERDFIGLLRIACIALIGGLIFAIIGTIIFSIAIVPLIGNVSGIANEIIAIGGSIDNADLDKIVELTARLLVALIPAGLITVVIVSFFANILEILVFNAIGLWMRQFNVPAWGDSDDPLPGDTTAYTQQQYYPPQVQQPYDPNAYQAPNQTPYAYGDTDYGNQTHGEVGQSHPNPQDRSQYPPQG